VLVSVDAGVLAAGTVDAVLVSGAGVAAASDPLVSVCAKTIGAYENETIMRSAINFFLSGYDFIVIILLYCYQS
jgi:hypothetical protein